jgi:hypothetical protein
MNEDKEKCLLFTLNRVIYLLTGLFIQLIPLLFIFVAIFKKDSIVKSGPKDGSFIFGIFASLLFFVIMLALLNEAFTFYEFDSSKIYQMSVWGRKEFVIKDIENIANRKFTRTPVIDIWFQDKSRISIDVGCQGVTFLAKMIRLARRTNGLVISDDYVRHICENY